MATAAGAGLFFLAFRRDLGKQFVPMQTTLAKSDALDGHVKHAVSVCPPACGPGECWGQALSES